MDKTPFLLALLAIAPVAFAHEPAGTPKNYCESPSEWRVHEWGVDPPPAGVHPPATPRYTVEEPPVTYKDGNLLGDCDGDGVPADSDGHMESGFLGFALLLAGPESYQCWKEEPHHPAFGPIRAIDVALGEASFSVGVDRVDLLNTGSCGDFLVDESVSCIGSCIVTFPPGADGAYHVQVSGTAGHVIS